MQNEYIEQFITAFYIDIRNYTELSKLKEPQIVVDFIIEYRETIKKELKLIESSIKNITLEVLDIINIGDAVLIIIKTQENNRLEDLKTIVEFSKRVRENLLNLLRTWQQKKDRQGKILDYFKEVNFGIGISQGKILMKNKDYIGFAINHAAKIGDMHTLSQKGHIGIAKTVFNDLGIDVIIPENKKDREKVSGSTKVGRYIAYSPYIAQYGELW